MAWSNSFSCIYNVIILSSSIVTGSVLHVDSCGHVSYEEPAILGRNATFTFIPSLYNENATLKWQRTNKINPWSTLKQNDKFIQYVTNGTFYLVVTNTEHTDKGSDAVFYRVQYLNDSVNCTMETSELKLKDLSEMNCGFVFLITKKIEQGKKVEIGYYPKLDSQASNNERTWLRTYNDQTVFLNIPEDTVYMEEAMANNKYVLTIFSFSSDMDGNYAVRCNRTLVTDGVKVILPVAPETLDFEGLKYIDNCTGCIVGSVGEEFSVYCQISGGTEVSVSMFIGNESLANVQHYADGRYVVFFYLWNRFHDKVMKCSAKNDALDSPMTVETLVYVIKQPMFERMKMPSHLREGDLVDITCKFSAGRPAPTLSLKHESVTMSPVQQVDTLNTTGQYYTSVLSLTTFNRSWNGQNISCCGYSKWYWNEPRCFSTQRVEYRFPPSSLGLQLRKGNQADELYAVCTVYDSNPICKVKWKAPTGSIYQERSFQNVSKPYGAWDAMFTASVKKAGNIERENITCEADCPDFNVTMKESIFLPYAPVLEFNTSVAVLEITRGSQVHVSCIARSSPSSNISWIEDAAAEKGEQDLKRCEHVDVCVISIQGHTISQRNFSCYAENLVGTGTKTLTVYITESKALPTEDETFSSNKFGSIYWILLVAAVAVVAVIVVVVVVLVRKRQTAKKVKSPSYNSHEQTFRHISHDGAEGPPLGNIPDLQRSGAQPDAVYSEVNKGTKNSVPDDDTMYSVVNNSGKSKAENNTSQANKNAEGGQLLYVDLAFDSPGSQPSQEIPVKRRESAVEYVSIDFSKTAEVERSQTEANEMENIYANQ